MYYDLKFPYRIDAKAGLATDERGNKAEAYLQLKIGNAKKAVTSEEYDEMHEEQRRNLASLLHLDNTDWVTPITGEEYEENTDEDD